MAEWWPRRSQQMGCSTSDLGHSRRFCRRPVTSGLPSTTDLDEMRGSPVRAVSDILRCRRQYIIRSQVGDSPEVLVLSAFKRRGLIKFRDQHCPRRSSIHGYRPRPYRRGLALLFLGRHDGMRTWRSFDWAAMERLYTKRSISDPVGKAKSVVDEGLRQSEALFRKLFAVGREV